MNIDDDYSQFATAVETDWPDELRPINSTRRLEVRRDYIAKLHEAYSTYLLALIRDTTLHLDTNSVAARGEIEPHLKDIGAAIEGFKLLIEARAA